jgi:hypothetical protein
VKRLALVVTLGLLAWGAWADGYTIESIVSNVTVERRGAKEWCVLDAGGTMVVAAPLATVLGVVTNYSLYPAIFPKVREIKADPVDGGVLLYEKVVVSVLGIDNVNRFTLKMVQTVDQDNPNVTRLMWTQASTDGTIDSLEGGWIFQDESQPGAPSVRIIYRNKSAVPQMIFGQDALIRAFLGGEFRSVLETVAKLALKK